MDVVVAEHTARARFAEPAEHAGGVGSSVHEVAHRVKLVRAGVETHLVEQSIELDAASLNVAEKDPAPRSRSFHLRQPRLDCHVVELALLADSAEQHSAAAFVAEPDECGRTAQPPPKNLVQDGDVFPRGNAAEK